jgi:hypothetical protein
MAIIHGRHPELKLNQTQVEMIQTKLLNAVDGTLAEDITAILVF